MNKYKLKKKFRYCFRVIAHFCVVQP